MGVLHGLFWIPPSFSGHSRKKPKKFSEKIFKRDHFFPVCPCPTPLFRQAKNTMISCGIIGVNVPKNTP